MSKRFLSITLTALALCCFASSCVKEKGFEERVTEIAKTDELSTRIATVGEQVKGMEKSITQLQSAQEKLEQYAVKLGQDLNAAKTDITTNAGKIATLQTELTNVEASIETIKGSIKTLEDGLSKLRTYVNDTVAGVRNWANATFATIDKTEEIATRLTAAEGRIQSNADSLRNFTDTVYTTVYSQFRKEISDSLASAETRIKSWVNVQLTGYWTIAQTKWKLDSVARAVEVKDSTALSDSLKKASEDLTTAYKAAIKHSIDSLAGAVNDTINNRIKRANDILDAKITAIDTRLTALEKTVEKLVARIQSIEVIPMYGDGSVDIATGDNELRFDIRPASFADSLVKNKGKSAFSLLMTGRDKRPGTKASSFSQVTLSGVSFDAQDSVVVVKFRGNGMPSGFFDRTAAQQGTLRINDGNTDKGSAYFAAEPLVSANCIICGDGQNGVIFKAVKGNSNIPVGKVASVEVLWETFGTSSTPNPGDVVGNSPTCSGGWITCPIGTKNGNAVIAAKDASGTILWSWHIWVCNGFDPAATAQEYQHDAGTMMDRNLGAIDTAKGSVGALGLLYQWGRKDPFLGSSSISSNNEAKSTGTWPASVAAQDNSSDKELNLRTSIKNPTTFITNSSSAPDWYCTNAMYKNDTLWKTSSGKTIYDPCPAGWRVPDGGDSGVWRVAFGKDEPTCTWDEGNKGFDFGSGTDKLVSSGACWYPAVGRRSKKSILEDVGKSGSCWSCSVYNGNAWTLGFQYLSEFSITSVSSLNFNFRALGFSVRCFKE